MPNQEGCIQANVPPRGVGFLQTVCPRALVKQIIDMQNISNMQNVKEYAE
jgi:hypothetical protein